MKLEAQEHTEIVSAYGVQAEQQAKKLEEMGLKEDAAILRRGAIAYDILARQKAQVPLNPGEAKLFESIMNIPLDSQEAKLIQVFTDPVVLDAKSGEYLLV